MIQTEYSVSNIPKIPEAKVAIIRSKWHDELCESMANKCKDILSHAGCIEPEDHILPGSVELPLAARRLLKRDPNIEAIVAFGVIVKGDTYHFDMVRDTCFRGFQQVMFEFDVPIINEVLPVDSIEHAKVRAGDDEKNKGIEAGIAAAEVIAWRRAHPTK